MNETTDFNIIFKMKGLLNRIIVNESFCLL